MSDICYITIGLNFTPVVSDFGIKNYIAREDFSENDLLLLYSFTTFIEVGASHKEDD